MVVFEIVVDDGESVGGVGVDCGGGEHELETDGGLRAVYEQE